MANVLRGLHDPRYAHSAGAKEASYDGYTFAAVPSCCKPFTGHVHSGHEISWRMSSGDFMTLDMLTQLGAKEASHNGYTFFAAFPSCCKPFTGHVRSGHEILWRMSPEDFMTLDMLTQPSPQPSLITTFTNHRQSFANHHHHTLQHGYETMWHSNGNGKDLTGRMWQSVC